jgi:catechol 2,3-dioxygenase-like lactoylglutathione lyase family enzyme
MVSGIFDDASMVATVVRVRDVAASVRWYREKLGLALIDKGVEVGEVGAGFSASARMAIIVKTTQWRSEWIATS